MTTMKHEAATDVATFAPSNKETLPETKALLNQVVADLYVAHIALHQVHWYMRGRGFMKNVEESLTRVLEIFHYLDGLYQKALDVTDAEGDDVTNDIFVGAKAELEKNIWMLAAELGQEPGL